MQASANMRRFHSRIGSLIMPTSSNILQVKIDSFAKSTRRESNGPGIAGKGK